MINLNQKTYSQPIAFILTLLLVFSMFVPMAYVYAGTGKDVSSFLPAPTVTLKVDGPSGAVINDGDELDLTKDIYISIVLPSIPVISDDSAPTDYVEKTIGRSFR